MKRIVAAGVQIAVHPNDPAANIAKAAAWLRRACAEARPDLVVFPESVTTGFAPALSPRELHRLVDRIPGRLTAEMQRLARRHRVHIVWPTYERGRSRGSSTTAPPSSAPTGRSSGSTGRRTRFPPSGSRAAGGRPRASPRRSTRQRSARSGWSYATTGISRSSSACLP